MAAPKESGKDQYSGANIARLRTHFRVAFRNAVRNGAATKDSTGRVHVGGDTNNFISGQDLRASRIRITRGETTGDGETKAFTYTQVHINLDNGGSVSGSTGRFAMEDVKVTEKKKDNKGREWEVTTTVKERKHKSLSNGIVTGQQAMGLGEEVLADLRTRGPLPKVHHNTEETSSDPERHSAIGEIATHAAHMVGIGHAEETSGKPTRSAAERMAAIAARNARRAAKASADETPIEQTNE